MQTVGEVGNLVLVVPLLVVGLNQLGTVLQDPQGVWQSPVLRFCIFSAGALALAGVANVVTSTRAAGLVINFTQYNIGYVSHLFYAVFSMAMFGAMYYLLPRVLNREWPSAVLIKAHFWAAALGITVLVLALYYFGWRQGADMNNPEIDFLSIVTDGSPLNHTRVAAIALLLIGHLVFFVNFAWMLLGAALECCKECLMRRRMSAAGGVAR